MSPCQCINLNKLVPGSFLATEKSACRLLKKTAKKSNPLHPTHPYGSFLGVMPPLVPFNVDKVIPKNIAILVLLLDAYLGAVEIHLQSVSLQHYYDLWNMLHDSQVFPKL